MSKPDYIVLEDLDIYKMAMEVGEMVWEMVMKWEHFSKNSLGAQFTDAADSIAANISEGYGRFHFKEKRTFYYYARGSLSETKTWSTKSRNRNLITLEAYTVLYEKLKSLHLSLNTHIKSLPIS